MTSTSASAASSRPDRVRGRGAPNGLPPVSYTQLDVYKRQKLANSPGLGIDQAGGAAIASAVTTNGAATSKWDGSGTAPKILLDVMKGQAVIAGQNLGYQADVLLISDTVWAYLAADSGLAALMARENLNNPVYTCLLYTSRCV